MTIQTINIGTYSNDGTGDDLRTAFQKVNENFNALSAEVTIANASNLGSGVGVFAHRTAATLEFKTLVCDDESITIDSADEEITLSAKTTLITDLTPTLGANLNLNNHTIIGGDVNTTVKGCDVGLMNLMLELFMSSNNFTINMGLIPYPSGYSSANPNGSTLDFGNITTPPSNSLDFGLIGN